LAHRKCNSRGNYMTDDELELLVRHVQAAAKHHPNHRLRAKLRIAAELFRFLDFYEPAWRADPELKDLDVSQESIDEVDFKLEKLAIVIAGLELPLRRYIDGAGNGENTAVRRD
jgi:hypothetical protein